MKRKLRACLLAACLLASVMPAAAADTSSGNLMYENSDFIETEQPELSEETKQLISLYQSDPTEENYVNLREKVIQNYNAVLERKEEKLAELKTETAGKPGGEDVVAEMEEIVQEMYVTYWSRINSSMLRFTDTRLLKWRIADAAQYEYIPVMGAGESVYIKRTPVTNAEYAAYLEATGAEAPSNWENGTYPEGEDNLPVNCVSAYDAEAYCAWLTKMDGTNTYRLPNESEWELAAGHMPKDAAFNCGVSDGRTPVDQYADVTRGAHGAVDFWGNVWEWTSTVRESAGGSVTLGVKGGSWRSARTDCRTEYRGEGRDASAGYEDVGFRVVQVQNGQEPEQQAELATLDAPVVTASASADAVTLSWQPVEGAGEYQLFTYDPETGLLRMLERTSDTTMTITGLTAGTTYHYIVQPISYTSIADNVSAEYCVAVTCGEAEQETARQFADVAADAYYYGAVLWAVQNNVTTGTTVTTFSPDEPCTRAQAVTFLWRAAGSPEPSAAGAAFTDIDAGQYYEKAVLWAVEAGVTNGMGDGLFGSDETCTRAQIVTMLCRAAGSPAADGGGFADVPADAYYADAVAWAVGAGVTNGMGDGLFCPDEPCTRAQIVTMLYRAAQ